MFVVLTDEVVGTAAVLCKVLCVVLRLVFPESLWGVMINESALGSLSISHVSTPVNLTII